MHRGTIGVLHRNLWAGKSVGYYYITSLLNHKIEAGYMQIEADPCVIYKKDELGKFWAALQ